MRRKTSNNQLFLCAELLYFAHFVERVDSGIEADGLIFGIMGCQALSDWL